MSHNPQPLREFHVEVDAYQINVRDRITTVQQLGFVLPSGLDPNAVSTYYFANGASTRTQGLDLKADYFLHFYRYGNMALSASLDLNRTRLSHVGTTTVNGVTTPLLTAASASYIITSYPRSNLILNAYWTVDNWDINLRQIRYGETTTMLAYQDWTPISAQCISNGVASAFRYFNKCFAQFKNTPRWLTDLEVGYRVNSHWHLTIGANNIFNIRPRRVNELNNNYGARIYDANSAQVPITGGYYFGRIDAHF